MGFDKRVGVKTIIPILQCLSVPAVQSNRTRIVVVVVVVVIVFVVKPAGS